MWIRSVSPCPAASAAHVHRFVEAWVLPQAGALRGDLGEVTGDVDDNGSWEVTLIAPNGPSAGATAHFYVRAACLEDDPWAAVPRDGDPGVNPIPVAYYEVNPLWVTSSGGGGSDGPASEFDIVTTTTTTTTTESTTTTTAAKSSAGVATKSVVGLSSAGVATKSVVVDDEAARAAEARAELARSDGSTKHAVALGGAPASTSTPDEGDPGIPWWSFVLATMLAIGVVVGWGARRSPSATE